MQYDIEVTRTFEAGNAPRLEVRTVHGSSEVRGGDRADVSIVAQASFEAGSDDEAAEVRRAIEDGMQVRGSTVTAHAPRSRGGGFLPNILRNVLGDGGNLKLDYEIVAPRGSSVQLNGIHGPVKVLGVAGEVRLHTINGSFELEDIGGHASVESVNGRGSVKRLAGDLDVSMVNGRLAIAETAAKVSFEMVHGGAEIKGARGELKGRNVSGTIEVSGPIRDDVSLHTGHGSITLRVPGDSRFHLDATSELGSVTSDLDVRLSGEGRGRSPNVRLRSHTGSIAVRVLQEAAAGV